MLYPCSFNVVISCWKSGAYGIIICRGGTDMCFVPESGWKHLDLEQYRISGLTETLCTKRTPSCCRNSGSERSTSATFAGLENGGHHRVPYMCEYYEVLHVRHFHPT